MNVCAQPPRPEVLSLFNARIVLPDGVIERGALRLAGGRIERIEPDTTDPSGPAIDCAGEVLMPGIVDIHTDHFERHAFPRPHVAWEALSAALAHDAVVIGAGITTVFDSVSVGAVEADEARRGMLAPLLDALETGHAAGVFRADHRIHLRCEVADVETPDLLEVALSRAAVDVASVMDHTPGTRQTADLGHYVERRALATGRPRALVAREVDDTRERLGGVVARVRPRVVATLAARTSGSDGARPMTLLSHDDASAADIAEARADGLTVAEFPTTLEAARAARACGMTVVAGAPNVIRGGSQSGNVAAVDLVRHGLVDVLASDYVPRALLEAVFTLAGDQALGVTLPQAVQMATLAPARATGLDDRGAIAVGWRADLVRVGFVAGTPFVRAAWRDGARVA